MKQHNDFMTDLADFDSYPDAVLWRAGSPADVAVSGRGVVIRLPYQPFILDGNLIPHPELPPSVRIMTLRAPGEQILHFYSEHNDRSPMLAIHPELKEMPLSVREDETGWFVVDSNNVTRARFEKKREPASGWSDLIRPAFDSLRGELTPDGKTVIAFSGEDQFFPEKVESLSLAYLTFEEDGQQRQSYLFSFQADYNEHFSGTGERFAPQSLRGRTIVLENTDALGVNSRRSYKNVPFYLSSRGYGLFLHTGSHVRLSLADISSRAAQGRIEEGMLDLFLIGGGAPEPVLRNYRCLTGFPPELPLWSYGTWMSRMTYFSADEIKEICERLRDEEYPCDVIHIDTGWFEKDWVCEWKFSRERFPDPAGFMKTLKQRGFRVSLWQTPNIGKGNCLLDEAKSRRFLAPPKEKGITTSSDFSGQDFGGQIDFTNPEAVEWYQSMIRSLLQDGASVIKTDFGEKIQMDADYMNLPSEKLHNLYGLLYQKAAFEETVRTTGEGIIWARAGWAGCQRYPLHWGGDAAATWDGMAGSLRGGLHLGLSGFGFWSHDVPGFHGLPEFMNTPPSNQLYMRWTQFGVFSSHLRYHGCSPREPWHFPEIAPLIREWLNLRYSLIPYFMKEAETVSRTGYPFLRAMLIHHPEDPVCWNVDDQFYSGRSFLVCPVMNDRNERMVYLPAGEWIDFWTGERLTGPQWLERKEIPLNRLPVYCPEGEEIPIYPCTVQSTDEMDLSRAEILKVDEDYPGWDNLTVQTSGDT